MKANSALREIRRLRRDRTGIAREPLRQHQSSLPQSSSTSSTASMSTDSRSDSSRGSNSISQRIIHSSFGNRRRRRVGDINGDYGKVESLTWSLRNSLKSRFSIRRGEQPTSSEGISDFMYSGPMFRKRWSSLQEENDDEESNSQSDRGYFRLSKILQDRQTATATEGTRAMLLHCKRRFRLVLNFVTISLLMASLTTLVCFNGDNNSWDLSPDHHLITIEEKNRTIFEGKMTKGLMILNSLSNLTTSYNPENETAFLWDVPLTGSGLIKKSISKCYNLTMASEYGLRQPDYDEDSLGIFQSKVDGSHIGKFVNVDLSTIQGIKRAQRLNLVESKMADVISMEMLYQNERIFNEENGKRGRIFIIFAHPVQRAVGRYHFFSNATWSKEFNPKVSKMSIGEYAESKYIQDNPIVRLLTNTQRGKEVTDLELELAKRIIQLKCLVGMYDDIDNSVTRFDRYFSWEVLAGRNSNNAKKGLSPQQTAKQRREKIQKCSNETTRVGDRWLDMQTTIQGTRIQEGSDVWNKLAKSNQMDLKLYEYAKFVYKRQAEHIFEEVS